MKIGLWVGGRLAAPGIKHVLALMVLLGGAMNSMADTEGFARRDRDELLAYARDTWRSVAQMADGMELPADGLLRKSDGLWKPSRETTPTDIASYYWSVVAAEKLKIVTQAEAMARLTRALRALRNVPRVHGFFAEKLDPLTGRPLTISPHDGKPIPQIISCVDNAWLAAGLIIVRNFSPSLRKPAEELLDPMDFGFFFVPYDASDPVQHPGQIHGPYHIDRQTFGGFHRIINTEQRIFSYIGIARGQIPAEHYYRVRRTLEPGGQDQRQTPAGVDRTYLGVPVFEGHYQYRGMRIVPSWGGSMFEALMVTLFVPEERWAPRSWGKNHALYVRAQIEYGLNEAGYGYWGFSPASDPKGGYRTYGAQGLASDPSGYSSGDNDSRPGHGKPSSRAGFSNGIVTPHASFLALRFAPREALDNLRKLKQQFAIYGDHGFLDSVNVSTGTVAQAILILDQGMILAAIANALADDGMRHAFVGDGMARTLAPLMAIEEFTAGPDKPAPTPSAEHRSADAAVPPSP